jgi:4'-phosphopantetheinyl transferase
VVVGAESVPTGTDWLTPAEQVAVAGMTHARRRDGYLARRWAGKTAVGEVVGPCEPGRVGVLNEPDGRPFATLDDEVLPIPLSLSDSGRVAVAASLAKESESALGEARSSGDDAAAPGTRGAVGVDVEALVPRSSGLVLDFFTPEEAANVARASDPTLWANLIWSAKESALKVRGTGLREDTRTVRVEVADKGGDGWARLHVSCDDGSRLPGWWLARGGFVLTLFTAREVDQPIVSGTPMMEYPPST